MLRVCLIHPSLIRLSTFPVSHREDSGDGEGETRGRLCIQKLWDFNMSTWRRSMLVALLACKTFALSALKADGASLRCITVSSCKHPHTPSNYQNIMQQNSYRILLMLCRKIGKTFFLKNHTSCTLKDLGGCYDITAALLGCSFCFHESRSCTVPVQTVLYGQTRHHLVGFFWPALFQPLHCFSMHLFSL